MKISPRDYGHGHCQKCGEAINVDYCFGCGKSEAECTCQPFGDQPHDFGVNNWSPIEGCLSCGIPTTHMCYRCDVHVCTRQDCRDQHLRTWDDIVLTSVDELERVNKMAREHRDSSA